VKAIETRYKGCRFRSRLEARWAVYFDAEAIKWEYEREGIKLPSGPYLPDFWLPQVSMWAEVKPGEFTHLELRRCHELADSTGFPVLLLDGPADVRSYFAAEPGESEMAFDYIVSAFKNYHRDEHRFFCSTGEASWPNPARGESAVPGINRHSVGAARGARFEHGESGAAPVHQEEPHVPRRSMPESWEKNPRILALLERIAAIDARLPLATAPAELDTLIKEKYEVAMEIKDLTRYGWRQFRPYSDG